MRNRWYDPNSGRFTQEDPVGFAGGINLYAYAGNDPVNFSDPFGLCPEFITDRPYSNALAIGVGFVPVAGDAIDVISAARGKDLLTGERIDNIGVGEVLVPSPAPSWQSHWVDSRSGSGDYRRIYLATKESTESAAEPNRLPVTSFHREKKGSINRVFPEQMRDKTRREI